MARISENVLSRNSPAVKKAGLRNGKRTEWRIKDARGLLLDVTPQGAATFRYVYYKPI